MAFLTDRKRAEGLGSAKEGTHHFWSMTISSVALAILIPVFVFTIGPMIGRPHAEVVAWLGRPFPAIVAGLTIVVGMLHFKSGASVMIEDYSRGITRKALIIGATLLSYAVAATGLFALARLAL
jgi:succinate dehydrogenase / fumarate reductase membrane anchor subunit